MIIHRWIIRIPILNVIRYTAAISHPGKLEFRCRHGNRVHSRIRAVNTPYQGDGKGKHDTSQTQANPSRGSHRLSAGVTNHSYVPKRTSISASMYGMEESR